MSNPYDEQKGWTPERIGSLKGKTYLITGATSGIGLEATKILLSKDAKVVMLNRNAQKSADTITAIKKEFGENVDLSFIQLDLGEQSFVKKAAKEVLEKITRIDALICNAAVAQVPRRMLTADKFESQLGINHYGHFTLQAQLYALIEKSKGRIVSVSSMAYNMGIKTIKFNDINWDKGYTPNKAYSQSKLAQLMCAYELQDRLKKANKTAVKVYACHPGASKTSLIKTSGSLTMRFIWWLMTLSPLVQTAKQGSYPALMCATEEDLHQKGFYGPTGKHYFNGPVGKCKLEPHAVDKAVTQKLWNVSEEQTGVTWNL